MILKIKYLIAINMEFTSTIKENGAIARIGVLSLVDPNTISNVEDNERRDIKPKKKKLLHNQLSTACVINSIASQKDGDDFINEIKDNIDDFTEARNEYLRMLNEKNGYEQVKNIYVEAINMIKITDERQINPIDYYITIKDSNKQEKYFIISEGEFIIVGRNTKCDFVSSNFDVSRINNVILKYMNKIYVFDLYSLNRTKICERKNSSNESVAINDNEQGQTVMKFNENESAKLKIGFETEIIISQKECIICFERQRNVLFESCKHCIMCSVCFDRYEDTKCPVCKTTITCIKNKYLCVNTMAI
jgi:hypothetical protein